MVHFAWIIFFLSFVCMMFSGTDFFFKCVAPQLALQMADLGFLSELILNS